MKKTIVEMNEQERIAVLSKLEWEGGYEYLITGSRFSEIKDKKFHDLRNALVKSWKNMEEYLGDLEVEES